MTPKPPIKPTEMIDVVDPTGVWIGIESRTKVHREGLWHNVFHCLIVRSEEPPRVVLQRRHPNSKGFPNKIDLSATGHLMAGEAPSDGIREIAEELGIEVAADQLVPVGVRLMADNSGEGLNRERIHLHFLKDDRVLENFNPSASEVSGLIEIEINEALRLVDHYPTDSTFTVDAIEWNMKGRPRPTKIAASELVPPTSGYWAAALLAAKRFVRGQQPLAV